MDPTVIHQPAAGTRAPSAADPLARAVADDQVVVGHIPAQPSGLQPRRGLLAQLSKAGQETPAAILTGIGGAGKTQVAAAYARVRLVAGWRLIAWVNARDSGSLTAGLASVAEAIGLPAGASRWGTADAGQAVRHWLEADGNRCLLVFDDVADPGLLAPFVPDAGAAHVLITTAREPAAEHGTIVPVDVFSSEEALAFLTGRTGLADEAGASAVAAELGHLPLALDQAAVVIAAQHLGYAAYLERLRALQAGDRLARGQDEEEPDPPGAAEAVLLSLEDACTADRLGVCTGMTEFMAVLAPASVHRDLMRAAGQEGTLLGGGRRVSAAMVEQALKQLNERSLLSFSLDGQAVSMHSIVARVIRGGLVRRGRLAKVCQAAATALAASAEAREPQDHAAVRDMLGQVTALLDNAGAVTDDAGETLAGTLIRLRSLVLYRLAELGDSAPQATTIGGPPPAEEPRLEEPSEEPRLEEPPEEPHLDEPSAGLRLAISEDRPPAEAQPLVPGLEPGPGEPPAAAPEPSVAAETREPGDETPPEPEAPRPGRQEPVPETSSPVPSAGETREPTAYRLERIRKPARIASLAAVILIVLAAGGATYALSRLHAGGRPAGHGAAAGQAGRAASPAQLAAEWVSQQVSRSAIVACDPSMCAALQAEGLSAARLLELGTHAPSLRGAELVMATPAVRSQFGSRLDSVYAPTVIAAFGSGASQVNVRVVAPDGAAAYLTALRQDVAARKAAGAQLLANKRIEVTGQARAQLTAGEVDDRLLIMLPALAATHPIQILAFGDPGPGAGPGVPLSSADLSGSGLAAGMTDASYLAWLSSFVRAQLTPFTGTMAVLRQGGQVIVRVDFARPSPLGLLTSG